MKLGATDFLTGLERAWSSAPSGQRVAMARQDAYDEECAMFHSSASPIHVPLQAVSVRISAADIVESITRMVRPGLSDEDMPLQLPNLAIRGQRNTISEGLLRRLLREAETSLVFGGTVDDILAAYPRDGALQVLTLLSHPLLGNRKNREYLNLNDVGETISDAVSHRLPIELVLPAFPFKDQNPFRTPFSPSHWDFGDVALLIRLHCIALGLNQLHPYDGHWLIVSDGTAYAQIFGVRESGATEYLAGLREVRNALNLQRTVHLIDLKMVVGKLNRVFSARFDDGATVQGLREIALRLEDEIQHLASQTRDVGAALSGLQQAMVWNINTRPYLETIGARDLWKAMNPRCRRLSPDIAELRRDLEALGARAAVKYSAFNMALSLTMFWQHAFPHSVRATVHGKAGQAAIPKLGRGDPWNAVGILDDLTLGPASIKTMPLWKVPRSQFKEVHFAGSPEAIGFARSGLIGDLSEL